jgi:hypothetical protein
MATPARAASQTCKLASILTELTFFISRHE